MVAVGGVISRIAEGIGKRIAKTAAENARRKGWWWYYTPLMAAASRAVSERIPMVDFVLEVRDARIPMSSECLLLRECPDSSSQRVVVLNKTDLANQSQIMDWMRYFEGGRGCACCGVNSHNKDSVKQLLSFIQAQVRSMKMPDYSGHTFTIMIVGVPNVGKSALANSLHHVGRISAAEKGKLKHAVVSPHPGETKDINSFKDLLQRLPNLDSEIDDLQKARSNHAQVINSVINRKHSIGSHPNIYVLDTPSVLPPEILDLEVCSKLALTGAITNCCIGEKELARYFLAILNLSEEYKKWMRFSGKDLRQSTHHGRESSTDSELLTRGKRQHPADHTQDNVVQEVRGALFEAISCFDGDVQDERDLQKLIEVQFTVLSKIFLVSTELGGDPCDQVAIKLLNLYRTGRLGHYTLEAPAFENPEEL